jgi:hypothetical protein
MRLANSKLLEKFGVTWEHEGGAIVDACKRMEAGLSESYKKRLYGSLHAVGLS